MSKASREAWKKTEPGGETNTLSASINPRNRTIPTTARRIEKTNQRLATKPQLERKHKTHAHSETKLASAQSFPDARNAVESRRRHSDRYRLLRHRSDRKTGRYQHLVFPVRTTTTHGAGRARCLRQKTRSAQKPRRITPCQTFATIHKNSHQSSLRPHSSCKKNHKKPLMHSSSSNNPSPMPRAKAKKATARCSSKARRKKLSTQE